MIALEAVEQLRENINTQHALGEMTLHLFLENVLHAPKVLSKFEIDTSSGTVRNSVDVIHLMPLEPASMRDELLEGNIFEDRDHARNLIAVWLRRYNEEHPHSALGWLSLNQCARQWAQPHQ